MWHTSAFKNMCVGAFLTLNKHSLLYLIFICDFVSFSPSKSESSSENWHSYIYIASRWGMFLWGSYKWLPWPRTGLLIQSSYFVMIVTRDTSGKFDVVVFCLFVLFHFSFAKRLGKHFGVYGVLTRGSSFSGIVRAAHIPGKLSCLAALDIDSFVPNHPSSSFWETCLSPHQFCGSGRVVCIPQECSYLAIVIDPKWTNRCSFLRFLTRRLERASLSPSVLENLKSCSCKLLVTVSPAKTCLRE